MLLAYACAFVQRNSFGDCWRRAVADARTCGKPPAGQSGRPSRECAERCSDPAHRVPEGTHFHDLRHFYAPALIAASLNPKVIQARMGHATMAETMETYGHLFPDSEDLGRGAVDDALGTAQAEQERNQRAG
jgi:integrase